jgi:peroxin-16
LTGNRKIAEVSYNFNYYFLDYYTYFLFQMLHLLRPMTHLACMGLWGTKSWKPWLVSFVMDVASLRLHSHHSFIKNLKREEKIELTRRTYALCYYLMRSPFYDTCTKKRLLGTLIMFSERIPLLGNICGVLAKAIPEWQNTYSYMWTDY